MGESRTHLGIDARLVGVPARVAEGSASVVLVTTPEMAADDRGLVHGGFVFGLADYAAMLAVNDPHVVLAASSCRFLKPVVAGEELEADALRTVSEPPKSTVEVTVRRGEEVVFTGDFRCYSPDKHVLD